MSRPFIVVGEQDPAGMKPGVYFYVSYRGGGEDVKVSRYCRRAQTAFDKADRYEARYAEGARIWPEVGRVAELRDSRYVVPADSERHLLSVRQLWRLCGGHL